MYEGEREIKTGTGEERKEGQKMRVVPLTKEIISHVHFSLSQKVFRSIHHCLLSFNHNGKEGQKMRAVTLTKESIPHVFLV